ncbi:unnamed protein product [Cuscuta epithymum]|uniref:AAA+ ATPase domain-containing protein n=1 Tax=Cuscuta epithymum TaxID=186058 RepID=A0AAV0DQ06_9ASTE|nr:unnamed protein product [Cuscuta epithymum]
MVSTKTILQSAASVAASAVMVRSLARDILPSELHDRVLSNVNVLLKSFSPTMELVIQEHTEGGKNQMYEAAESYLGRRHGLSDSSATYRLRVALPKDEAKISTTIDKDQQVIDRFNGVSFTWTKSTAKRRSDEYYTSSEVQCSPFFTLTFHKKHKQMVFDAYFPFILAESIKGKLEQKTPKLFSMKLDHGYSYSMGGGDKNWKFVKLDHPSTFQTLAMDTELKISIMEDLDRFVKRREYYRKVGKAWKRGYLLYGPPGTGKSSLIAAMANYLEFDIYDLDLTAVHTNCELKNILLSTGNRSILVVEDIDCSVSITNRIANQQALSNPPKKSKNRDAVTLSGLLNFIDGLWSSCGDERIIVFTTNHKERLDPALLRPGRMDVHIHMSYCTYDAFLTLAKNYMGIEEHSLLFPEIQSLLEKAKVTPAEVGEHLLSNDNPDHALQSLVDLLKVKITENENEDPNQQAEGEAVMKPLIHSDDESY